MSEAVSLWAGQTGTWWICQWICERAIHSVSQEVTDSNELANVWAGYLFTRLISDSLSHSVIQKLREIFMLLASEWVSHLVRQVSLSENESFSQLVKQRMINSLR
jgi:hypothetical protein